MAMAVDDNLSTVHEFEESERNAVYRAIFARRDVRRQFTDRPVSDEVLHRLLTAAHHAPSVGFMQPWNFTVIRSDDVKQKVHDAFGKAHAREAAIFDASRREAYLKLKLEGIREAPVNLCVTCDRSRHGPVVLGRTANTSTDLYSTVCAVQNLWLAARAEGIGVGWVSILDEQDLKETLGIPGDIVPVAYLCVGYVDQFLPAPELETAGWLARLPLDELVFHEQWGQRPEEGGGQVSTSVPASLSQSEDAKNAGSHKERPQRVKRITLIRHASVAENREHRFVGRTDAELSDDGRQEAQRLSALLDNQEFDRVWCSPLRRTRETLETISSQRVPAEELPATEFLDELREIDFGAWEGRTFDELTRDASDQVDQWHTLGESFVFPEGEAVADFRRRVDRVIERIAGEDADSFLLVTHGGVIRHLICRYLDYAMNRSLTFQVLPASLTTLELYGEDAMLTALNTQPQGDG